MQETRDALAWWKERIMTLGMLAILILSVGILPATAQRNVVEVSHPSGLTTLQVEDASTFSWTTTVSNQLVTQFWQRPSARFRLITGSRAPMGGNPTKTGDENRAIASVIYAGLAGPTTAAPTYDAFSSKLTVAIDGQYYDLHVLGRNESETTGSVTSYWPVPPQGGTRDVYGVARIPLDDPDPKVATESIDITHTFTLIHDAVRIDYIVTNNSGQTHSVGLRQLVDASFGQWTRDGGTIVLPNGQMVETERTIPDATVTSVPDYWVAYDRLDDPTVMVRGTLESADVHDPGIANTSAGKPDEISFGFMRSIGADLQWNFTPNTSLPLEGEDWAYAAKWLEADLQAGRSRRYVTYYGLGAASVDFDSPYALAAYSPIRLEVREGDNPVTAEIERFYLTDRDGQSPFPVYAYADNFSPSPLIDASVRISLPDGFVLDPPTQSLSKSLGTVARNELKSVSWTVRATVARPGAAIIKFTGPNGKTVERSITVPVIPALTPQPSANGLEMVSIPYQFADSSVEHVFGSLGSMHVGGANGLARWTPDEQIYRWFPHQFVSNVIPGEGYWLLNLNRQTVFFPDDLSTVATNFEYSVQAGAGWNQIGTPYTSLTYMKGVRVIDQNGSEWSMSEAVARALVLPTVFAYNAADGVYVWATELRNVQLSPYIGYWLYCLEDLTLLFSPDALVATAGIDAASAPEADGWKIPLVVSGAGRTVGQRYLGMFANATDGLDANDVLAPPAALANGVVLTAELVNPETGTRYMQDARRSGADKAEWSLAVATNAAGETVTVQWPDLSQMPSSLVAVLEDTTSGERRYMRTSNSYSFRPGSSGDARLLKVTVQPRETKRLLVQTATAAQSGGGVNLVYSLSADANVDVEIRNISGVLVKRVVSDEVSTAGVNTQLWDSRNARGARVPAGRYLFRVTARSPMSGEQHSVVSSFQLAR